VIVLVLLALLTFGVGVSFACAGLIRLISVALGYNKASLACLVGALVCGVIEVLFALIMCMYVVVEVIRGG